VVFTFIETLFSVDNCGCSRI